MTARSFDVLTVGSPLHDPPSLRRALEPTLRALASVGGREAAEAADGPLAVLVGTGGTEAGILRLHAARQSSAPAEPLLLVTHASHNSLPAALEALARVRLDGGRGRIVHLGTPEDERALASLVAAVDDLRTFRRLHRSRIGLVGAPSDWLVASIPDATAIRRSWGPETAAVDIGRVLEAVAAAPDERAVAVAGSFRTGAAATREPDAASLRRAACAFTALADLASAQGLDAVAVRCFDLVTRSGTSGCLALAELNDRGTVAACEGDLASAVAMLWVRELLGTTSWMANPVDADPASGALRLAHCTIARSLVTRWELRSHFESGKGVALAGSLAPGPVTLVRLGGRALEQLFVAEGEAAPSLPREDLCRTQVDVALAPAEVEELLSRPLGNHLVLVPGRWASRLRDYRAWAVAG